ncbi:MAG: phosphoribosylamine--glycine ligase [Pseudobdellovibrionaceae bacterium]
MNILLIGSGGREHALAWKIAQSPLCSKLFCTPGNPGMAEHGTCVPIPVTDIDALVTFAQNNAIDLVIPGPETPLVLGLKNRLDEVGIVCFGPSQAAAQLEGSKGFMKDLCKKYNIPTAAYERFTDTDKALAYIEKQGAPIVIKADGLAAGKGVIVAQTVKEAQDAARDMLAGNSFGSSGSSVVIEEFLDGEEISYFALCDGENILPLTSAQDHKRAFDGDQGPNTGGMGAYSPAHLITSALEKTILDTIIKPTATAMKAEDTPFTGIFFAGLMVVDGIPKLLEYNVRFGDPECQTLMLRLESDLVEMLYACAKGDVTHITPRWSDDPSLCIVMAAKGYPGEYVKDTIIRNLDEAVDFPGAQVFHAGTILKNKLIVANGGRVLSICAKGKTVSEARTTAYAATAKIDWPESFYRHDIAWRALKG